MLIISKRPNHFQPFFLDDVQATTALHNQQAGGKHMGISHDYTDVALRFMLRTLSKHAGPCPPAADGHLSDNDYNQHLLM